MDDMPEPAAALSARILIVEDEPVIAADIADILVTAGHRVVGIAGTQREAYSTFLQHKPDLIMADLQLADGSSGLDAVRAMIKIREVPSIFVTAFPERLLTVDRPRQTYLITKPFQPATLVAAVAKVMAGDVQVPARVAELRAAAGEALEALERVEPTLSEANDSNWGHNGPPDGAALPYNDFGAIVQILERLENVPAVVPADTVALVAEKERLSEATARISSWAASTVAEGFLTKFGENLADVKTMIGLWLIVSGSLDKVVTALINYLGAG